MRYRKKTAIDMGNGNGANKPKYHTHVLSFNLIPISKNKLTFKSSHAFYFTGGVSCLIGFRIFGHYW